MKKTTSLFALFALALTALYGCTDSCNDVAHPDNKLAEIQKTVGNFKKGKTTHYVHSNGFEFDLAVTQDSIYTKKLRDFCVDGVEETRSVILSSTYPIISVEINFYGSEYTTPMTVRNSETSFYVELESEHLLDEENISTLDTITFNGVTYDSVLVVKNDDKSRLYFSKKKGILKLEISDDEYFTIKEGGDNE
ncbi:hypothetical protein B7990_01320 [Fibrobacter sp. UWB4]|uniref:hypothetical protein n=1 Tax=Fibrobacter sp. UWB4 TaxID=1964356 RepID=UPI000B523116|nr:hypothetical protein [Fibrobacter sp. UWB4]OWV19843.1 hypothetical protein B7990_01320 [Fibrobacter sp. UWB4]